ncbi:hypothetical protein OIU79_004555 [Salix purpurea]|uniref:Uncharacterized protein n=1 Tax=Salix purpurea TaxID=77065 RepID=A0A9Q0UAG0_SALPP|nr:hypothetical protein OIU79_004555 [Salix purpurea]
MTAPPKRRRQSRPPRRLRKSLKNPRRREKGANQESTDLILKCIISCGINKLIVPCCLISTCNSILCNEGPILLMVHLNVRLSCVREIKSGI